MSNNGNNEPMSYSYISESGLSTNPGEVVKGFDSESPKVKQAVEQLAQFDPKQAYIGQDGQVYPNYEASPDYLKDMSERHAYNDIEVKRR